MDYRQPADEENVTATQHLKLAEKQVRLYLLLADEVLALEKQVQQVVDEQFGSGSLDKTERHRVLVGLSLKAIGSFDRLVLDAREGRGECSHHLKTMAECFIYWVWVSADLADTRARLLLAKSYQSMKTYHKNFSDDPEHEELVRGWDEELKQTTKGIEAEWRRFKDQNIYAIASGTTVQETYYKVYRFACAAAHLADLYQYTPPYPIDPGLRIYDLSLLRTYVTLGYGIHLALDFTNHLSRSLKLGHEEKLQGLWERKHFIEHELPKGELSSNPAMS